jgi:hypothetical protein
MQMRQQQRQLLAVRAVTKSATSPIACNAQKGMRYAKSVLLFKSPHKQEGMFATSSFKKVATSLARSAAGHFVIGTS